MTLPRTQKVPIEAVYRQKAPNEPISLGATRVLFTRKTQRYERTAQARMSFAPHDGLRLVVEEPERDPALIIRLFGDDVSHEKLELPDRQVSFDVLYVGCGGENGAVAFTPRRSPVTVTPPATDITSAIFHIFNFPDFIGPNDYILEKTAYQSSRCAMVVLRANGWAVTICGTEETKALCQRLRGANGFVITHVGKAEREDGACFSSDDLEELLKAIHYFLSFALGRWAGVGLPVGVDGLGNRKFEQWGLPVAAPGAWNSCSWFDTHNGAWLGQVFPGFLSLWSDEFWRQPLREILYWYLGASDRGTGIGVDTGLVLAQTALELLAWTYCVQFRKMVSSEAFEPRGLSAADKLRLLASALDIPLALPAALKSLHAKPCKPWADGMDAITGIRNAIVHPHNKTKLPDGSYYDGWRLSLWYLDLALLRLCGYSGNYANRLQARWVGQTEQVPWAEKQKTMP